MPVGSGLVAELPRPASVAVDDHRDVPRQGGGMERAHFAAAFAGKPGQQRAVVAGQADADVAVEQAVAVAVFGDEQQAAGEPGGRAADAAAGEAGGDAFVEAARTLRAFAHGGEQAQLAGLRECGDGIGLAIVRMLVGVYAPTSGAISVLGAAPHEFTIAQRERIGYTPQGFFLYPSLTVKENASFVAGMYGLGPLKRRRRIRDTLQFLEIWDARKRLAHDISGGMQRRLTLACALLHNPDLLIVDEPTAGLDPVLREKIWGLLRDLRDQGKTVLVTTQYLDEAAYCDTVAVFNKGTVAAVGTPDALR